MRQKYQQLTSEATERRTQPKPISGIVARVIQSLGLTGNYNGWMVVARWPEIVGEGIARVAKAINYEEGCLHVAVNDSSWRQELAMRKEELLTKIHSYPYGRSVKEIRLVRGKKGI